MDIKHTPGPWVADLSRTEEDTPYAEIHPEGDSGWVNGRYLRVGGAIDEHDARLIAAAPDLLAALERLSFAAECRDNTMGDACRLIEVKAELASANQQARAAIAKATSQFCSVPFDGGTA